MGTLLFIAALAAIGAAIGIGEQYNKIKDLEDGIEQANLERDQALETAEQETEQAEEGADLLLGTEDDPGQLDESLTLATGQVREQEQEAITDTYEQQRAAELEGAQAQHNVETNRAMAAGTQAAQLAASNVKKSGSAQNVLRNVDTMYNIDFTKVGDQMQEQDRLFDIGRRNIRSQSQRNIDTMNLDTEHSREQIQLDLEHALDDIDLQTTHLTDRIDLSLGRLRDQYQAANSFWGWTAAGVSGAVQGATSATNLWTAWF